MSKRAKSLGPGRIAVLGALGAFGATGCVMGHHDGAHDYYWDDGAYYTTVDADVTLSTDLGQGAGLFVEYEAGGVWHLWTSCDSALTGRPCYFDVTANAGSEINDVVAFDFEPSDQAYAGYDNVSLHLETGVDYDEVSFRAWPGVPIQVELVLDGYVDPQFFRWFGEGYVHEGAPYSPVVFEPSHD